MPKSEFEKLVEVDVMVDKYEKDREKVHEIALLEKERGEMPYVCNDGMLFTGISRKMKVFLETWDNGQTIPARELEIQETAEVN